MMPLIDIDVDVRTFEMIAGDALNIRGAGTEFYVASAPCQVSFCPFGGAVDPSGVIHCQAAVVVKRGSNEMSWVMACGVETLVQWPVASIEFTCIGCVAQTLVGR